MMDNKLKNEHAPTPWTVHILRSVDSETESFLRVHDANETLVSGMSIELDGVNPRFKEEIKANCIFMVECVNSISSGAETAVVAPK